MHRRPVVLPILRCACVNRRHVATATKLKPRNWSLNSDNVHPHAPTQQLTGSKQESVSNSQAYTSLQESSRHNRPRSREHNLSSVKQTASQHQKKDLLRGQNKSWTSHQPGPGSHREGPRFLGKPPDADAVNKWAKPLWTTTEKNSFPTQFRPLEETTQPSDDSLDTVDVNHEMHSLTGNKERDRPRRTDRNLFKGRGSLLSSSDSMGQKNDSRSKTGKAEAPPRQEKVKVKRHRNVVSQRVDVYIPTTITVGNLARLLNVRLERLQKQMRLAGIGDDASHDYVLTADYAALFAEEFGRNPVISDEAAFDICALPPHPNPTSLPSRPPVVAIMGHVDHGKTTLLDTLRSASVAKGEAGGITQHIGAFSVPVPCNGGNSSITFLDTPGHAAFTAMRARGARVTDIIVLVVAVDDGVMPQTREIIDLIKKEEGNVGVVVAINKVDKPGIDIDGVQKALLMEGLQLESFGGDIPCVTVSGLTGDGLPELIETISAMAEMQDLRAERDGSTHGYVLESNVLKGLGPTATVLVLRGRLKIGSHIISGVSQAKVRVMKDAAGIAAKAAYPGMAVTVSGWKILPSAGDEVLEGNEADVKKAVTNRERKAQLDALLSDVDIINKSRRQEKDKRSLAETSGPADEGHEEPKELKLIIKADVSGSVEAVVGAIQGIGNDKAAAKVVFSGVGDISEADVMMAKALGGTIMGFSVTAPRAVETLAARSNVPVCTSAVIYRLMDDVRQRVINLLPVSVETAVTGEANVLQIFEIRVKAKETKKVAGCRVINGVVEKALHARVVRNGTVIHEGRFDTIRHLKMDVTEVRKGSECGLSFSDFYDLHQGDLIQTFKRIETPGIL
ncbi:translation initiation factor IF-2 [Amanita muscaria]